MKATARDLRYHTKRLLQAVERGDEVTITHRGKPTAKLVPIQPEPAGESPAFGLWSDREDLDVEEYVRAQRRPRS